METRNTTLTKYELLIENISKISRKMEICPEKKVDMGHFKIIQLLGSGVYGKVYLVVKRGGQDLGRPYAMKVVKKNIVAQPSGKKEAEYIKAEREILEEIHQKPFLVQMHYAFQTATEVHLILDYMGGGNLLRHLRAINKLPEDRVRVYVAEIVVAVENLHELGIIYCDLKLENTLLDANGHLVLADFGLSEKFPSSRTRKIAYGYRGTPQYMAPEIVRRRGKDGYGFAVDWWSLGILTYELLTGFTPFADERNPASLHERILKEQPFIPQNISDSATDFILKLLEKNPENRLGGKGANDIKSHPFFDQLDWEELAKKEISPPFKPEMDSIFDTSNFEETFPTQPHNDGPFKILRNVERLFQNYSYVSPLYLSDKKDEAAKDFKPFDDKYELLSPIFKNGEISAYSKCKEKSTGRIFVVKTLPPTNKHVGEEIEALQLCQGQPNIVQLHEVVKDAKVFIITQFLEGGSLMDRIKETNGLAGSLVQTYLVQIVRALNFMHSNNIAHGDLRPESILFEHKGSQILKITGFGEAIVTDRNCSNLESENYLAPDKLKLRSTKEASACDMWSLGALLHTMVCWPLPFRIANDKKIKSEVANRWKGSTEGLKHLCEGLLKAAVYRRLTITDVMQHELIVEGMSAMDSLSGGNGENRKRRMRQSKSEESPSKVQKLM